MPLLIPGYLTGFDSSLEAPLCRVEPPIDRDGLPF
jgi:hypothetical protein